MDGKFSQEYPVDTGVTVNIESLKKRLARHYLVVQKDSSVDY